MISSSIAVTKTNLTDINCSFVVEKFGKPFIYYQSKSVQKQLVMVIPRYVPGSEDSPLLKIGTINPVL